jgi:hypothetical protein
VEYLVTTNKISTPEKLSLNDFLEMYKNEGLFAIDVDQKTQAYVILVEHVPDDDMVEYTHPACDEVPLDEYVNFMVELRKLRFDYHKRKD